MLHGLQEALGLSPETIRATLVLGGGVGGSQSICGALNGAAVAIGLTSAAADPSPEARQQLTARARQLWQVFESSYGALDCRTLTGFNFREPGEYGKFRESPARKEKCPDMVAFAVTKVLENSLG